MNPREHVPMFLGVTNGLVDQRWKLFFQEENLQKKKELTLPSEIACFARTLFQFDGRKSVAHVCGHGVSRISANITERVQKQHEAVGSKELLYIKPVKKPGHPTQSIYKFKKAIIQSSHQELHRGAKC